MIEWVTAVIVGSPKEVREQLDEILNTINPRLLMIEDGRRLFTVDSSAPSAEGLVTTTIVAAVDPEYAALARDRVRAILERWTIYREESP